MGRAAPLLPLPLPRAAQPGRALYCPVPWQCCGRRRRSALGPPCMHGSARGGGSSGASWRCVGMPVNGQQQQQQQPLGQVVRFVHATPAPSPVAYHCATAVSAWHASWMSALVRASHRPACTSLQRAAPNRSSGHDCNTEWHVAARPCLRARVCGCACVSACACACAFAFGGTLCPWPHATGPIPTRVERPTTVLMPGSRPRCGVVCCGVVGSCPTCRPRPRMPGRRPRTDPAGRERCRRSTAPAASAPRGRGRCLRQAFCTAHTRHERMRMSSMCGRPAHSPQSRARSTEGGVWAAQGRGVRRTQPALPQPTPASHPPRNSRLLTDVITLAGTLGAACMALHLCGNGSHVMQGSEGTVMRVAGSMPDALQDGHRSGEGRGGGQGRRGLVLQAYPLTGHEARSC